MATAPKKTTSKKSTAKAKAATPKKMATTSTATKKAPIAKKTAPKKQQLQSFRVARESEPFMTFKLTQQTLYWLVIGVISVGFATWVYVIQKDINSLYVEIERMQTSDDSLSAEIIQAKKAETQKESAQ